MNDVLRKIDKTGSVKRKAGSGRPQSVQMQQNISFVYELICSQWDNPGNRNSPLKIEQLSGSFVAMLCCVAYAF